MKKIFKKSLIFLFLCICTISLVACDASTGITINTNTSTIELNSNGHGKLELIGDNTEKNVLLNETYLLSATPDENYHLESVYVNDEDITTCLSFTPLSLSTNYTVYGTFVPNETGTYYVSLSGPKTIEVGKMAKLTTTIYGPDDKIEYFSTDTDVATVSEDGIIKTNKAGFVTITATAVNSPAENKVFDTVTIFVMPTYIAKLSEIKNSYSLEKGIKVNGAFNLTFPPSTKVDTESDLMKLELPYEITLKKTGTFSMVGNLSINLEDSEAMLIKMILQSVLKVDSISNCKTLNFAFLDDGNLYFYGVASDESICYFKEISITKDILPELINKLKDQITSTINNALSSIKDIFSENTIENIFKEGIQAIDLGSLLPTLNQILHYGEDFKDGIALDSSILVTIQKWIDEMKPIIKQKIGESLSEPSLQYFVNIFIDSLLPVKLSGVRLSFEMDESGNLANINFSILDTRDIKDGDTTIPYEYEIYELIFKNQSNTFSDEFFVQLKQLLDLQVNTPISE